jgi:hypothetical protein
MISIEDLRKIAQGRLKDAEVLIDSERYDGAVYLSGYAVEIALKARICQTLKWTEYPFSRKEFEGYKSFCTHDLDILLHLSGIEEDIKTNYFTEWSVFAKWDPNTRYRAIGTASLQDATDLVKSVKKLLRVL